MSCNRCSPLSIGLAISVLSLSLCSGLPAQARQTSTVPVFASGFEGFLNTGIWEIQRIARSDISSVDGRLVLEDTTLRWGAGTSVQTRKSLEWNGAPLQCTLRKVEAENATSRGQSVQIGFAHGARLLYWHTSDKERVALIVNDEKVWDSHIWNKGNLLPSGTRFGFRLFKDRWEVISAGEGEEFGRLLGEDSKNPSAGALDAPLNLNFAAPLRIAMKNGKGGHRGARLVIDDLAIHPVGAAPETANHKDALLPDPRAEKLLFAISMHCYPLNRAMNHPLRYADRPLDWDPRMPGPEAEALKAQLMEKAGVDVDAQTVFYGNGKPPVGGNTATGLRTIERRLEAFKGTSVKIAPEVVSVSRAQKYGTRDLAEFFEKLIARFHDHPGIFRHKGRMVVFLWNPLEYRRLNDPDAFGVDDMAKVWEELGDLREKMYVINESYYLVPCDNIAAKWNTEDVRRELSVCDDLFFWYSEANPEKDHLRDTLLAQDVRALTDDAPVIASVRPGYWRKNTGGLNPFNATRKLRRLWDANTAVAPDWMYLYSWDDYSENGMFEPTRSNRGMYSAMIRTLSEQWKGKPVTIDEQTWIGTRKTILRGMPLHVEVARLDSSGASAPPEVRIAFEDAAGERVHVTPPLKPVTDGAIQMFSATVPTTAEKFLYTKAVSPLVTVANADGRETTFRGIAPVRILDHHPVNPLYRFTRLETVREPETCAFEVYHRPVADNDVTVIEGRFRIQSQKALKRVELRTMTDDLLGYESERAPERYTREQLHLESWHVGIEASKQPPWNRFYLPVKAPENDADRGRMQGTFRVDGVQTRDPFAMVYLFIEYQDGSTYATRPRVDGVPQQRGAARPETVVFDLGEILTGESITWEPVRRKSIAWPTAVVADWKMEAIAGHRTAKAGDGHPYLAGEGRYGHPLYPGYGPNTRRYRGTEANRPSIGVSGDVTGLVFDGADDVARLPDRIFPAGTPRVEMRFRFTEVPASEQWLFYAKNRLFGLKLLPGGKLLLIRGDKTLRSKKTLEPGKTHTVAAGDDAERLYIVADGELMAQKKREAPFELGFYSSFWNDLLMLGGGHRGDHFKGVISRVRILCATPAAGLTAVFAEQ